MSREIKFMDTTLRDAHQSLIATRLTMDDMRPILDTIDQCGYYSLEVWGGATFDVCLRFLNEDPWERLRTIRKHIKNTKLQMLLRGQNILGYKHYPDDVLEKFIEKAIVNGIDIIRIFDALNDPRNVEPSIRYTKKYGGHAQVAICYTISDIHTDDYYVNLVKKLEAMGADSIAFKDMAGILTPARAYELVGKIKKVCSLPLEMHMHETSGISEMTYLKAVEAGADILDCAISSFAGGTSQMACESMGNALEGFGYKTTLNFEKLAVVADYFKKIKNKYRDSGLYNPKVMDIEPKTLLYQVPGGMLSNLLNQLKESGNEDKYEDVLKEVPRVRAELGYPPLVTPLSQMVGTQAVMNVVLKERYKVVPHEIKEYVQGYYGRQPAPIDPDIQHLIIGDEPVITERPADLLEPRMAKLAAEYKDIVRSEEDVLDIALFPDQAIKFLKKRNDPFYDVPIQNVTVVME